MADLMGSLNERQREAVLETEGYVSQYSLCDFYQQGRRGDEEKDTGSDRGGQ